MDKQKQRILRHYNVDSLRKDITRLQHNIKVFSGILKEAREKNSEENIKVYLEAIEKAKEEMVELESYIKFIEENGNGDTI